MKNMADLDPEEEKLLAEALFETANDYFEQDVELDAVEDDDGQQKSSVPNSKVQFPIRRRRSTLFRKLICFVIVVVLLCGALVGVYFLLKSKTVSLDLKLARGQTLRYRLEQESIYEGLQQVRASFSEDVFVHVVNKTGNLCWLEVKINSMPTSKYHKFSFLVRIHLDKQKTRDYGEEERFSVFTLSKRSREMDFYVYNFLCQLIPVVKIDLFEILLSQITTRKHDVAVQDPVLFPGIATMQQTIRTSDDQILVTSKINPEGFGAVGSRKTRPELPRIEMTFEEDASISKSSGMLKTSDMELSAKIAFGEDAELNPGISMKFKSSLRFVEEIASKLNTESMGKGNEIYVRLPQPSAPKETARLRYFFPSEKNYNENSNIVEKVKELLSLTSSNSDSTPRNEDMIAFSKSFHQSVDPGQEVNFAAVQQSAKKAGKLEQSGVNEKDETTKHESSNENSDSTPSRDDYDDMDSDGNDDAPEDRYDDGDGGGGDDDDDDDQRWNNRSGLAVPFYPEDSESKGDESLDERYQGPEDDEDEDDAPRDQDGDDDDDVEVPERMRNGGKTIDRSKSKAGSEKIPRKTLRKNDVSVGHRNTSVVGINKDSKNDDKTMLKTNNRFEHDLNVNKTTEKEKKPTRKVTSKSPSDVHRIKTSKVMSSPTKNSPKTSSPTTSSPRHQQNVFTDIFDRLWHNLDDEDDDDNNNDNEFKLFPPPVPFSISSHFPFLHLRWPSLDDRKKRSLETKPQSRKPRDAGHRDKRRLFGRAGERPQYTGDDLESIWDVISFAKTNARPKKTTNVFKQRVMGLEIKGDLEHEVQVITMKDKKTEWVIRLCLFINVGEHRFQVLSKTYTMKEIEERFIKHTKPKFESGTVHGGTLVLCTPLFYIENICIEIQLGFVIHVSHSVENISKEFPVELSIFFKHLAKVDALISSHMSTLLGSSGVFGHGTLFGAKIPLEVKFSEEKSSGKWCSVANLKSKIGHFYERKNEMRQWSCAATKSKSNCTGLNENSPHKITKLWYINGGSKKLHFLNNC